MDWSTVILSGLIGGATTMFFAWLLNRDGARDGNRKRLSTSPVLFWLLVIFCPMLVVLGPLGGYQISVGGDGNVANPLLGVGLGSFMVYIGLGGLWQARDSRTRWADWDQRFLTIHQGRGPAKTYRWADVTGLHHRFFLQADEIRFNDGNRFIVFEMMTGCDELLDICRQSLQDRR